MNNSFKYLVGVLSGITMILCASQAVFAGQVVTVNIGHHCLESRYGTEDKCNANAVADCKERQANNSCGFEDLTPPAGDIFQFSNAYCQDIGPLANPWEVICQGSYQPGHFASCPLSLNSDESGYINVPASTETGCKAACVALSMGDDMWVAAGLCSDGTNIQCQCNHLNNHTPPH